MGIVAHAIAMHSYHLQWQPVSFRHFMPSLAVHYPADDNGRIPTLRSLNPSFALICAISTLLWGILVNYSCISCVGKGSNNVSTAAADIIHSLLASNRPTPSCPHPNLLPTLGVGGWVPWCGWCACVLLPCPPAFARTRPTPPKGDFHSFI